jgi:hypothetical protein
MSVPLTTNFVGSPYIVLSTSDPGSGSIIPESGIVLSNEDGTLISYSEEWDGDQYGIDLQLIDPDGLFISKIFTFYIDSLKAYFTNFSNVGNKARDQQIARVWKSEYLKYLRNNVKRDPRAKGQIMTIDQGEYGLTDDQKETASEASFQNALNILRNSDQWKTAIPELQKALESLNAQPDLYINIGIGDERFRNYSGYKHVIIKNLMINQDSGKEHLVFVKLLADNVLNEKESDLPIKPVQTNSQEGSPSYFPKANSKYQSPILYDAVYNVQGDYLPINLLINKREKLNADNTSNIVFAIEDLLEGYLDEDTLHGIVFLNPALEFEMKKTVVGPKGLHALNSRLKNCGVGIKVTKDNIKSTTGIYQGGLIAQFDPKFQTPTTEKSRFKYSLQLELGQEDNISKKQRVLNIIRNLYEEFGVFPNDISYRNVSNDKRIEDIYRQLYTAQVTELPEEYRNLEKGTKEYNQQLRDIERQETNTATLTGTTFIKKSSIGEDRIIHKKGVKPRNILLIGDDYFINSLIFPIDILFTENEFSLYEEFIAQNLFQYGQWKKTDCNVSRFVIGSAEQGLTDYLKKWTSESYISGTSGENIIPDEFALRFNDVQINTILKISEIFIAGAENSNVYEVTSKEDGFSFSEFLNFFSVAKNEGYKSARDYMKDSYTRTFYDLTEDEKEALVENAINQTLSDTSIVRILETVYNKPIRETEEVKNLRTLYSSIIDELKNSSQVANKSINPKALTSYLAYINNLSQRTRQIVIKTHPSFYIDESKIGHPAFFFHNNPFVTSSQSNFSAISVLNGLYKIYGYRHVIDEGDCYTEVVLIRNPISNALNISANLGMEISE